MDDFMAHHLNVVVSALETRIARRPKNEAGNELIWKRNDGALLICHRAEL
jgi:hypothetical protein